MANTYLNDYEVSKRVNISPVSDAKEEAKNTREDHTEREEVTQFNSLSQWTTKRIKFKLFSSRYDKSLQKLT